MDMTDGKYRLYVVIAGGWGETMFTYLIQAIYNLSNSYNVI